MVEISASIREGFLNRQEDLRIFDIISGTGTPGQNGNPDINDPDSDFFISDVAGIATLSTMGLTGISYGLMKYSQSNPTKTVVDAMKPLYEKIQVGKALEAAQEGKNVTKLMEFLPTVGLTVKRMNIDALWGKVEEALELMQVQVDLAANAIEPVDNSMDKFNEISTKAFYAFGSLSVVGTAVTAVTATYENRVTPFLNDVDEAIADLDAQSISVVENAMQEAQFRMDGDLAQVDSHLDDIEQILENLPDFNDILADLAAAESLLAPIQSLTAILEGLEQPYEDFLNIANVIGAPIEGIFTVFENPPELLPTFKTIQVVITPGFWTPAVPLLGIPAIWVPPVTKSVVVPDGFKEIFSPIQRSEIQEIIDLITGLADLPYDLLETALDPILGPIQDTIDNILNPILDTINPFDDYLDDFASIAELLSELSEKFAGLIAKIEDALAQIEDVEFVVDDIQSITALETEGDTRATFFGTSADEVVEGEIPSENGGFFDGALLYGKGGKDILIGTLAADFLNGGNGDDALNGFESNDVLIGGRGNDTLDGGAGEDMIVGGRGSDEIHGGDDADNLFGSNGSDMVFGDRGKDTLTGGSGDDTLSGGNGKDEIDGGTGSDLLIGGGGADALEGDKGNDTLVGEKGDDTLSGGKGKDEIDGGTGQDLLIGGDGSDAFLFKVDYGQDTIMDFSKTDDDVVVIDNDGLFANDLSAGDVIDAFGTEIDGNAALDFGNGDVLIFAGLSNVNGLVEHIDIV